MTLDTDQDRRGAASPSPVTRHPSPDPRSWYGLGPADVRRNFLVQLGDNVCFWLGFSLTAPATMLALYVSYLTDSNVIISLVPAIAGLAWALPQIVAARWVSAMPYKKPFWLRANILGRLALVGLTVSTFLTPGISTGLALALTFLFTLLYRLQSAFSTPAWSDLIAKTIPPSIRGRWYGTAQTIGTALGALMLVVAREVLERFPFPTNFGVCFAIGTLAIACGLPFMLLVREPPSAEVRPAPPLRVYLASLPELVRRDANFQRYLWGRVLLMLSTLAVPLLGIAAVRRWQLEAGEVALFTAVMLVTQTLATFVWGWVIDRQGSKRVMEWAGVFGALGGLAALLAPGPWAFAVAFACVGASMGAYQTADGNIVLEFAPHHDRPRYVGLTNTWLAPWLFIAPLIGGVLADHLGYPAAFAGAFIFALAGALVLYRFVADPRRDDGGP